MRGTPRQDFRRVLKPVARDDGVELLRRGKLGALFDGVDGGRDEGLRDAEAGAGDFPGKRFHLVDLRKIGKRWSAPEGAPHEASSVARLLASTFGITPQLFTFQRNAPTFQRKFSLASGTLSVSSGTFHWLAELFRARSELLADGRSSFTRE